ncbi:hypothetical protein RABR111495_05340 [Rahnella bruchi]|uniref:hypothetical protein n=1 Tax=Rahnella bruchi TaxID=1510573 RepID=UPI0013C45E18|nr:hypothetical protein [Rahnella bruchi]
MLSNGEIYVLVKPINEQIVDAYLKTADPKLFKAAKNAELDLRPTRYMNCRGAYGLAKNGKPVDTNEAIDRTGVFKSPLVYDAVRDVVRQSRYAGRQNSTLNILNRIIT